MSAELTGVSGVRAGLVAVIKNNPKKTVASAVAAVAALVFAGLAIASSQGLGLGGLTLSPWQLGLVSAGLVGVSFMSGAQVFVAGAEVMDKATTERAQALAASHGASGTAKQREEAPVPAASSAEQEKKQDA